MDLIRQLCDPVGPWQRASRFGVRGFGYALGINLAQLTGAVLVIRAALQALESLF